MKNYEPNIEEITGLVKWSDEDLKEAEADLKMGFIRGAISKAYYSAFDLVRALLLSNNILVKSHKGAIDQFSQHFVKTGMVSKNWGKWFAVAQRQRQQADYDVTEELSNKDAEKVVAELREFRKIVKNLMK